MTIRRMVLLALLMVLASTQSPILASTIQAAAPAVEARSAPEQLTADTQRVTGAGASFMVPAGWSVVTGKNLVILQPPEADTHIAIVDTQASDAAGAVAAGWAAYKPEHKWPVKVVTSRPPREGWEDRQVFDYETSPNERAVVQAVALRAGSAWTAVILDGSEPTFEKRSAPIGLIVQSLRPKGYHRESFAGRKAHPLDAARIADIKAFV
ncbi:MAG: serine hydrolase, partial [Acidobacteria bacterium]